MGLATDYEDGSAEGAYKRRGHYNNKIEPAMPRKNHNKKAVFNPKKEWERVKDAWDGDKEAWARYAGVKLDVD